VNVQPSNPVSNVVTAAAWDEEVQILITATVIAAAIEGISFAFMVCFRGFRVVVLRRLTTPSSATAEGGAAHARAQAAGGEGGGKHGP
jgi:hypothetical protein